MDYRDALQLMLDGRAVVRANDENHERIYFVKGVIDKPDGGLVVDKHFGGYDSSHVPLRHFQRGDAGIVTRLPRFDARDTYGNTVTGWTPTATDQLATDWHEVDENDDPI